MNKKLFLLSVCSLVGSHIYSMQQPVARLTFEERRERARQAYRVCERSYHLKCAAFYEETETQKTDREKCEYTRHISCMKVAQEKFTEGIYEEVKEFFEFKK